MKYSKILGTGSYLPPRVWTNDDLKSFMDTTDEWIQQRTGIKQRHWVDQNSNLCTSDLALEAAKRALEFAPWRHRRPTSLEGRPPKLLFSPQSPKNVEDLD